MAATSTTVSAEIPSQLGAASTSSHAPSRAGAGTLSTENAEVMQCFHWYPRPDGTLWQQLDAQAPELAQRGFTAVWIPPAYKGQGGGLDVGYGTYDLFDLGEFNQKGSIRTKYGTRTQLLDAIAAL